MECRASSPGQHDARRLAIRGLATGRFGYSSLGTRFSAFFTVPRSVIIFCCSRVMA
jgi:hypothetical protein